VRAVYQRAPPWLSLEEDAAPTRLTEILDRAATVIRTKLAKVVPAAPGEEQSAQELMILLHTGPFLIKRGETSTADKLRKFAGHLLDRIQITKQKQRK
jgi:hypothetical protein